MNIKDFFGQTEYAWAVPVVFFGVLLVNLITGIYKGWKSGLYYAGWNIVAIVVGVFATKPIVKLALENIDTSNMPIDLQGFLNNHPAIVPLALIGWLLVIMPIAFLIKLFFRKALAPAKPMSAKARLGSMAISTVSALPLAVLAANATTIATGSNDFSPFIDGMVQGITFNQYEGISKYVDEIANVVDLVQNGGIKTLEDLFAGQNPQGITADNHNAIQNVLNGPSLPSVLENAKGSLLEHLKNPPTSFPTIQDKFEMTQSSWDQLSKTLSDNFKQYGWDQAKIDELRAAFINVK